MVTPCEACGGTEAGTSDEGLCWDCIDAAEEATGLRYGTLRMVFGPEGLTSWVEDVDGNVIPPSEALILDTAQITLLSELTN